MSKRDIDSIIDSKRVKKIEKEFNKLVKLVDPHLKVTYKPDPDAKNHAVLIGNEIIIHDLDPDQAFMSLLHEVIEHRLKPLTREYRLFIEHIITFYEKMLDLHEEIIIEMIAHDLRKIIENRK